MVARCCHSSTYTSSLAQLLQEERSCFSDGSHKHPRAEFLWLWLSRLCSWAHPGAIHQHQGQCTVWTALGRSHIAASGTTGKVSITITGLLQQRLLQLLGQNLHQGSVFLTSQNVWDHIATGVCPMFQWFRAGWSCDSLHLPTFFERWMPQF